VRAEAAPSSGSEARGRGAGLAQGRGQPIGRGEEAGDGATAEPAELAPRELHGAAAGGGDARAGGGQEGEPEGEEEVAPPRAQPLAPEELHRAGGGGRSRCRLLPVGETGERGEEPEARRVPGGRRRSAAAPRPAWPPRPPARSEFELRQASRCTASASPGGAAPPPRKPAASSRRARAIRPRRALSRRGRRTLENACSDTTGASVPRSTRERRRSVSPFASAQALELEQHAAGGLDRARSSGSPQACRGRARACPPPGCGRSAARAGARPPAPPRRCDRAARSIGRRGGSDPAGRMRAQPVEPRLGSTKRPALARHCAALTRVMIARSSSFARAELGRRRRVRRSSPSPARFRMLASCESSFPVWKRSLPLRSWAIARSRKPRAAS
jgi:hypothetical protein